jgi:TfoX/Sxy family transcriptional regulator of competence genes
MAYDERLADRIRATLRGPHDVVERKMFGGIAFMVAGRMACGVIHNDLMVRVGAAGHDAALGEPHTRPMDFIGRRSRGMVYVAPASITSDVDLARSRLLPLVGRRSRPGQDRTKRHKGDDDRETQHKRVRQPDAKRRIDRPGARADERQCEGTGRERQRELEASVLGPEPGPVNDNDRDDQIGGDQEANEGCQQTHDEQTRADGLHHGNKQCPPARRPEADAPKEASDSGQAWAA